MGAFNKEKVLVRGLLRTLWKLREGSLRDHWPVWRWAHTWSPRSLHMSGGPVRAGPHTPARTPPRVGPQLTVVRRVANITQPDKYFYRARSKYFCSDRSVLSVCGMWAGSAGSNWRNEAEENNSSCQMNSCEYFLWTQRWRWRLSGVENLPKWFLF